MKKILFVLLLIISTPVFGVNMCVQLDYADEGVNFTSETDGPGFTVTEANGIVVRGLGLCSTTSGAFADIRATIKFASSGNVYCWCKIFYPAVSKWTYYYKYDEEATCFNRCSYRCGDYVSSNPSIRNAVFSTMSM